MKKSLILTGLLALLLVALWFKGALVEPAPVPERSAAGEFDTRRAMARLARVLAPETPHPVDSAAGDAVRGRLVRELRALGLHPRVTAGWSCNGSESIRAVSCARVRNVVATTGAGSGRHVLLVSHHDSALPSAGAADAGIGMAVMLETAALLKDRRLGRPVTLLFTDGEEVGLLGARDFLERDPLAGRVGAVVNFEARGVTGPALMFETSRPNAAAVEAYAGSVERPAANSMTTDFYGLIPNSTDVAVFQERPWTILNFAIIGNETRYHSPGDRVAALDPRSVAHMGAQALAVTARLAQAEGSPAGGEKLYADLLGRGFVTVPLWLGIALLAALIAGWGWAAWRRRSGVAASAGIVLVAMADAALTVFVLQWLTGLARPGEWWRAHPEVLAFAIDVTALASAAAALLWLGRPIARDRLRTGYWLLFLLFGAGLSAVAPGAIIFFLAPPAAALVGVLFPRIARPAALAAWGMLFLTLAPILHLSQVLLDFDFGWAFAPLAVLLLVPVLIELQPLLVSFGRGRTTAAVVAAAALAWGATFLFPAYSEERKQAFGIDYVVDGAKAQWMVVNDGAPLPRGFEGFARPAEVPWSGRKRWAAPAPPPPAPAPALAVKLGERPAPGGRLVSLRLHAGEADMVMLQAEESAQLKAVRIGNATRPFGAGSAGDGFAFRCSGRGCDGATVELLVGSRAPVELEITSIRSGLPDTALALVAARPATAQPQYHPDSTVIVSKLGL